MKATDVREQVGKPVQVAYLDPAFRSDRTLVTGIVMGMDEEAERPLVIVQLGNGRVLRVDPAYVVEVKPPAGSGKAAR